MTKNKSKAPAKEKSKGTDRKKDLKKATKAVAKVTANDVPTMSFEEEKVDTVVAEVVKTPEVAEEVVETEVVAEVPREKNIAEVQADYVENMKSKIAELNKAKADWLAKNAEEMAANKKEAELKAAEVSEEITEEPLEKISEEVVGDITPAKPSQEEFLERYLKIRGSYTDINQYELSNYGFDIAVLDSHTTYVVGRFTMSRTFIGAYWSVVEQKK